MRCRSVLLTVACLATASPTLADPPDPAALSLAKTFAKICMMAAPNFTNVMLTARIEGWEQVDGPKRDKMVEFRAPPTQSSWVTKGVDGLPIGVTIVRTSRQDVRAMAVTCAVENPDVAPAGMANALAAILPLPEPEKPVVEGDRTTTVWSVFWGNQSVGVAMVADTSNKPGVILNAVIQQNVR